jgi:subtilisin family serine protease
MRNSFAVACALGALLLSCNSSIPLVNAGPQPVASVIGTVALPYVIPAEPPPPPPPPPPGPVFRVLNWTVPHVPGEVLIVGTTAKTLSALGISNAKSVSANIQRAPTPEGSSDEAFAARLAQSGLRVQPNYLYFPSSIPNDPGFPGNAGLFSPTTNIKHHQDYLTRIKAQEGWDALAAAGAEPVGALTAVIDSGVDATIPELQGRVLATRNMIDNTDDATDEIGHGTAVIGIISANTNNNIGLTGLTWSGPNILAIKVYAQGQSSASSATLASAISYSVGRGAKVINMSIGQSLLNGTDAVIDTAIDQAVAAGVVLVASAGNSGGLGLGLSHPASNPNVIAVGSIDSMNHLSCFTSTPIAGQKEIDLVAPGGESGDAVSNCTSSVVNDLLALAPGDLRTLKSGTSYAAPQVSGAVSLLRAFRPDLNVRQIRYVLTQSANQVNVNKQHMLDVGAAVRLAAAAPSPNDRSYELTIQVTHTTTGVTKTVNSSGTLAAQQTSVPVTVPGLVVGDYYTTVSLKVGGLIYTNIYNLGVDPLWSGGTLEHPYDTYVDLETK